MESIVTPNESDTGRVLAIWIKRAHRGPMDHVTSARFEQDKGIAGNADRGGRRQVTIIEQHAWDAAIEAAGEYVDPATRRANVLISAPSLAGSRGKTLMIGECRINILGETRPCNQMEEAHTGLQQALRPEWRGGVFGRIENNAEVSVGDAVRWADA
jgi:MOSC domain-containing protein YiiM